MQSNESEMKWDFKPQIKWAEWANLFYMQFRGVSSRINFTYPSSLDLMKIKSRVFVYHFANLLQPQASCRLGNLPFCCHNHVPEVKVAPHF